MTMHNHDETGCWFPRGEGPEDAIDLVLPRRILTRLGEYQRRASDVCNRTLGSRLRASEAAYDLLEKRVAKAGVEAGRDIHWVDLPDRFFRGLQLAQVHAERMGVVEIDPELADMLARQNATLH